jgi:hypothetical protein
VSHLADDRASLNSACLVNRLWAAVTLPLFWRRVPRTAIEGAATQRSGVYDSAIRALDVIITPQGIRRFRRHLGRQRWRRQRRRQLR